MDLVLTAISTKKQNTVKIHDFSHEKVKNLGMSRSLNWEPQPKLMWQLGNETQCLFLLFVEQVGFCPPHTHLLKQSYPGWP